jgi:transcriptional regulator with XRE-family HTH domain
MKTVESGAVNPLQRMLGTHLRLERARLGYSSKDVADKLGLTDSYLRLAESGRASLNQSLVFRIIGVFADSIGTTLDTRAISFPRLAIFLVGVHWVGAEMAGQKKQDLGRRAMENLAAQDADFEIFVSRTSRYFDLDEGSSAQRAFLEEVAAPEVGRFLRTEAYSREDIDSIQNSVIDLQRDLLALPTLNLDLLLDLKRGLEGRSFVHTAEVAANWESQRASQFAQVRGLFVNANHILNRANFERFHYEFLSKESFTSLRLIFIDTGAESSTTSLTNHFIANLNAGRKKAPAAAGLEPLTHKEIAKIHIVPLNDIQRKQHAESLAALQRGEGRNSPPTYDAYWAFETHYKLHIGFVGWRDDNKNADSTRNLTLGTSFVKAKCFDELWRALHDQNKG